MYIQNTPIQLQVSQIYCPVHFLKEFDIPNPACSNTGVDDKFPFSPKNQYNCSASACSLCYGKAPECP